MRICEKLGRCKLFVAVKCEKTHEDLTCCTREKENLRAGEAEPENIQRVITHKACKGCADHHAEECGKVGKDRMERKIVGSVLVGEIDIWERCHDGIDDNTHDMLSEADDDIQPNGIRRYERICKIGRCLQKEHKTECAEPIMLGDELFPHRGEKDEEKEVSRVDAVTKRIADTDLVYVYVEGRVGEVGNEGIRCGNQNRAKEATIFEGQRENIGKLCFCRDGVWIFLGNEPNEAIDHSECKRDIADKRQHEKLVGGIAQAITDKGHEKRDGEGDGAIDTAGCIEIVDAHVIGQEVRVPRGKTRGKKLVDAACRKGQHDKADNEELMVMNECRKQRDADDIDEVCGELAHNEDDLAFAEML